MQKASLKRFGTVSKPLPFDNTHLFRTVVLSFFVLFLYTDSSAFAENANTAPAPKADSPSVLPPVLPPVLPSESLPTATPGVNSPAVTGGAVSVETVPVRILWPSAEGGRESGAEKGRVKPGRKGRPVGYRLEVSDDSHFGKILLKSEVKDNQLLWEAPHEGVYHWRVSPLDRQPMQNATEPSSQIVETSSLASGSFLIVEKMGRGTDPVKIEWTSVPGVSAYHLRMQHHGEAGSVLVSLKNEFQLPRQSVPIAMQIVPHYLVNNSKISQDVSNHFDAGLRIVPDNPVVPVVTHRELVIGDEVPRPEPPDAGQHFIEALPPPPPAIVFKDSQGALEEEFSDHRVNEVLVGIYGGRENLRTSKGPTLVRSSKGNLSAGFLSLRTIPLVGFQLLAQADGHGREANWKDADGRSAGSQPISTGLGTVGVGFDTFFKNPNRRHQLVLEVRGALGRFPSLPVDASPEITDQSLGLKMNEVQLAGGGLWYRWTLGPWGLGAFGSMMVQSASRKDTNDATLDEWGGFLAFDPLKYVTVQVGGRSRIFSMARCSKDQLRCVTEGTAKTSMSQSMGFLGLGYVMR